MRQAFTLPELLLVLALGGILLGIAIPRLSGRLDRIDVYGPRPVTSPLPTSEPDWLAVTHGQVTVLSVDPARLTIRRPGASTPLWSEPGPEASGVSTRRPGSSVHLLARGTHLGPVECYPAVGARQQLEPVWSSRLGRVRIVR